MRVNLANRMRQQLYHYTRQPPPPPGFKEGILGGVEVLGHGMNTFLRVYISKQVLSVYSLMVFKFVVGKIKIKVFACISEITFGNSLLVTLFRDGLLILKRHTGSRR